MRIVITVAFVATLAACGNTQEQRAATGGLGGMIVAGPAGAAVGATAGAVSSDAVN